MAALITYEMVPKAKLPLYGGLNSVAVALATLMGPLFGGLINNNASWRWVFYLKYVGQNDLKIQRLTITTRSLPVGVLVNFTLLLGMPRNFPNGPEAAPIKKNKNPFFSRASLAKLDVLGAALLLSGSLLLTTALLEVSHRFSWSSGGSISLLVVSGLSWICFLLWERYITGQDGKQEPVFPWRFVHDRAFMGLIMYGPLFVPGALLKVTLTSKILYFMQHHISRWRSLQCNCCAPASTLADYLRCKPSSRWYPPAPIHIWCCARRCSCKYHGIQAENCGHLYYVPRGTFSTTRSCAVINSPHHQRVARESLWLRDACRRWCWSDIRNISTCNTLHREFKRPW